MADIARLLKNLEKRGFTAVYFDTAAQAADYLDAKLNGRSIGIGGSYTVQQLKVYDRLCSHNEVHWHWGKLGGVDTIARAAQAEVYISSANGVAETGEIINIDGTGNRVAATIYGHEELYLVIGVNKIRPTFEEALWRARNIASPKNAQRLGRKTPCAVKGDRCYDCDSPERICKALSVFWKKPGGISYAEVVVIGEELGY